MLTRRPLPGLTAALLVILPAPAARADTTYRTPNFVVTAPTAELAQEFGTWAERYRKQKAVEWLGQEMPPWPRPCPLKVTPKMSGPGGATTFNYDYNGGYDVLSMNIEGGRERMLHSVLPHEITHTVFAHYFRYPVPRWADEGGSVLSEDEAERANHDRMCRDMLNGHQAIQLRRLFQTKEYQELNNVMALYAEGFSVSEYLVGLGGRPNFLAFVYTGMRGGNWDQAAQTYYRFPTVEALEEAWLKHLRDTKGQRGQMAATPRATPTRADVAANSFVRNTAPPAQPQLDPAGPVARGQSSDWFDEPRPPGATLTSRPTHLPEPSAATVPAVHVPAPAAPPLPPVRLGLPEFGPAPVPLAGGG
jgi:hypothetical protein